VNSNVRCGKINGDGAGDGGWGIGRGNIIRSDINSPKVEADATVNIEQRRGGCGDDQRDAKEKGSEKRREEKQILIELRQNQKNGIARTTCLHSRGSASTNSQNKRRQQLQW
jgi:hypothetical protein